MFSELKYIRVQIHLRVRVLKNSFQLGIVNDRRVRRLKTCSVKYTYVLNMLCNVRKRLDHMEWVCFLESNELVIMRNGTSCPTICMYRLVICNINKYI